MKKTIILPLGIAVFILFASASAFADALFDSSVVSGSEWARAFDCIDFKNAEADSNAGKCSFSLHSGTLTEFEYGEIKLSGTNDVFFLFDSEDEGGYLSSNAKLLSGDDSECNFVFLLAEGDEGAIYVCATDGDGTPAGKWTAVDLNAMDSYVALYNMVSDFGNRFKYLYKDAEYSSFDFNSKKYKCYSISKELDSGTFMQSFFFFDKEKRIACIMNKMYISGGSVFEMHEFNYNPDYGALPDFERVFDDSVKGDLSESDPAFRRRLEEMGYGDGDSAGDAAGLQTDSESSGDGGSLLAKELLEAGEDTDVILSKIEDASSQDLFEMLMYFEDEMESPLDSAIRLAAYDAKADFPSNDKKRSFFSVYAVFLNEMCSRLDAVENMAALGEADASAGYDSFLGESFEDATGDGKTMTLYDLYARGVRIEDNAELLKFAGSIKLRPLVRAVWHMMDSLATALLMKLDSGGYVFKDAENYMVPKLYFLAYMQLSARLYEADYDFDEYFYTVGDIIFRIRSAMSSIVMALKLSGESQDDEERELLCETAYALAGSIRDFYDLELNRASAKLLAVSELTERYRELLGRKTI